MNTIIVPIAKIQKAGLKVIKWLVQSWNEIKQRGPEITPHQLTPNPWNSLISLNI